jgi:LacI family transcriptional regulator
MEFNVTTIYDVAEESGFSVATVSKVFNRYSGVNDKTREMVLLTARRIGYAPIQRTEAQVNKKSWLVGVIFKEDLNQGLIHPHFGGVLETFKLEMEKAGYDIIFINRNFSNQNMRYLEHCRYRNVDGALLASSTLPEEEAVAIHHAGIKCVSVEKKYPKIPTVISTNYEGSMNALTYLYSLGHRRIGILASPLSSLSGYERFEAYKYFLKKYNLNYDPSIVSICDTYSDGDGLKKATELINKSKNNLPTAIFATYDKIAIVLQSMLLNRGLSVPNDISIIGFDDIEIASVSTPTLTTLRQYRSEIGRKAADLMKRQLNNETINTSEIFRIPTELIIRDSTCRARIIERI